MGFNRPFKAVPIKLGQHYRRKAQLAKLRTAMLQLTAAIAIGGIVGAAGYVFASGNGPRLSSWIRTTAISVGLIREREPQWGDNWKSCDEANAVGTWSITISEPGYSSILDRDRDGVACEPYRRRRVRSF